MGHFSFCSSNTSDDDEEEDYESEEDEQSALPGKENLSKQEEEHAVEKEDWESEEDEEEDEEEVPVSPVPQSGSTTKSEQQTEKDNDSEDEDEEDEDGESVSSVPQACPTTKSVHAQQKEVVIEERHYDKAEDYESEEDEEVALEREVSWSFWSSLARGKQSVPRPEFMADERRALDPTDTRPGTPAMSTGIVESTSDGLPTGPEPQPMFTGINPKLSTPNSAPYTC
jgi:hypothetical protein